MHRKRLLLGLYGCQLLLIAVFKTAHYYYYNHLGFMRNFSFYSRKITEGPIGVSVTILSALLLGFILYKGYLLKSMKRSPKVGLFNWLFLMILGLSFCYWQFEVKLSYFPLYYVVSAIFIVAISSQFLALNLALKQK